MKFNKLYQAIAVGVVAATCLAQPVFAQKRTVQIGGRTVPVPDDASTGTDRAVVGIVQGVNEQRVRDIVGQTAGGATLLPYDVPEGSYYNNATYPLQLAYTAHIGGGNCGGGYIIVGGAQVATASDGCDGGDQFMTAIVPAKTSFSFGKSGYGDARMYVTAMANGATWQATGVLFSLGESYTTSLQSSSSNVPYYFCMVGEYGDYGYTYQYIYASACNVGSTHQAVWGYAPSIMNAVSNITPAWNGGIYGYTTVTVRSCSWTRRTSNNWGQTTVSASGSIPGWPVGVSCDATNVTHYFAGTGPFTVYVPPPDIGAPG
jgi:hypothetical protein